MQREEEGGMSGRGPRGRALINKKRGQAAAGIARARACDASGMGGSPLLLGSLRPPVGTRDCSQAFQPPRTPPPCCAWEGPP